MIKRVIAFLKGYGIEYNGAWVYDVPALPGYHDAQKRVYNNLYSLILDNNMYLSVLANDLTWVDIRYINDNPAVFTKGN